MKNILKEIEANYPVERVLVNGHQVWSYLRVRYNSMYRVKEVSEQGERGARYPSFPRTRRQGLRLVKKLKPILKRMKGLRRAQTLLQTARKLQIFYGFRNWFGNYEYIVLSNSAERRELDGTLFHKLIDPVSDRLGRDKVLYIERGSPSLCPIEKVYSKHIVSSGFLTWLAQRVVEFMPGKCEVQHEAVLESIQHDYGLKVDDLRWIRRFTAQRKLFSLMFRMIKPRAVFVTDYISYSPAIKAAKELGIKVMEFQHGTIGKEHPSYNIDVETARGCFPDYLLVFGSRELETFANSYFIEAENVLPIGSFYIEYLRNNHVLDGSLVKKLENYNRTVVVTLQWAYEKRTIEFIVQAANLDPHVFYILIPRLAVAGGPGEAKYAAAEYLTLELPGNVAVVTDRNFYELMMYVDFHATIYSTCALEAPALGTPNILINIDNMSQKYLGTLLPDNRVTRYADTPEEFVRTIDAFQRLDRDAVRELNQDIIAMDYERNIEKVISEHLLDEREGRRG